MTVIFSEVIFEIFRGVEILLYFRNTCFFFFSSVCKAAKADLVFLVDGSWSIGDDNFNKIISFLYSTVGALDKIGPDGTQVINIWRQTGYQK